MWVQSGTFICSIIVLNLNISFNFCARLDFNVIWFVKCMKIRKLKIEIIEVSAAYTQVTVSAANMWVTIFIVIIQGSLCCNYADGIFCSALCT